MKTIVFVLCKCNTPLVLTTFTETQLLAISIQISTFAKCIYCMHQSTLGYMNANHYFCEAEL